MKRYEIITLILLFAFGLLGAGLSIALGDFGEYLALFICVPPPILAYVILSDRQEAKNLAE